MKPFLKWAGGKYRLVDLIKSNQIKSNQIKSNQIKSNQIKSNQIKSNQIKSNQIKSTLPKGNRLIEPFVGSGALFLNTDYSANLLADSNPDLINLFQLIQKDGQGFISYCQGLFVPENNTELTFYKLREEFNSTNDLRRKAALFVYLNRHCFNGLCRYNSKGGFNVPFGRYSKPALPEKEMFYFHEKSKHAVFEIADSVTTMEKAKSGDVVY